MVHLARSLSVCMPVCLPGLSCLSCLFVYLIAKISTIMKLGIIKFCMKVSLWNSLFYFISSFK